MSLVDEVLADSPMAYWRCNEGGGTTLFDSSGNGRHATHGSGAVTWGRPGLQGGQQGTSIRLTNAWFNLPFWTEAALNIPNYSIESWTHQVTIQADFPSILQMSTRTGFNTEYASNANGWMLYMAENFDIYHFKRKGVFGPGTKVGSLHENQITNCFQHVVVTYDGTWHRIYLNGALHETYGPRVWGTGDIPPVTETSPFRLGRGTDSWNVGDYDVAHVAMYNHTLSHARILAHWQTVPPCYEGGWRVGSIDIGVSRGF